MPPQLDGSKSRSNTTPSTGRCGIRARIANLFRTREDSPKALEGNSSDEVEDASPMRVLSPRSTISVPTSQKRKRHSFSFRKRRSKTLSRRSTISTVESPMVDMTGGNGEGGNVLSPVSTIMIPNTPFQSPIRVYPQSRGSTMSMSLPSTPASPTREAALTSHPIVREADDESDVSGKFVTPMEERDSVGFETWKQE